MFERINFTKRETRTFLTSYSITEEDLNDKLYNRDNLLNSNFSIIGSVDSFKMPPVSDFALNNLYHMEAFNIFHYGSGSYTERQNYNSFLILYTYSGCGALTYKNRNYKLNQGDGFFINCTDYHKYQVVNSRWDTAVLHVNGPLSAAIHSQFLQIGSAVFTEPINGQLQQFLEKLLYLYHYPHLNRDWLVSNCIDNLLTHLLQINSHEANQRTQFPDHILYLIRYMEHNYSSRLSLDFLANFSNINKYHLSREFKKYTGFSPNDYLISLRISQAKLLLKNTTLPSIKIAHEVGIHDSNNFINLFKKKTGMTPIQYRNSNSISY